MYTNGSLVDHASKSSNKKLPNKINFFIGFVIFSFIASFIVGGIYFGKNKSSKQAAETNIQEQVKITKEELPDNPDEWQVYQLKTLGLELKLPEKLAKKGDWKEQIIPASEKGSIICFSNKKIEGAACSGDILFSGGTSTDFAEGREETFTDLQGFRKENGKIYIKRVGGKSSELSNVKFREINNVNNVAIIKILGENQTSEGTQFPLGGTPGEGYLGAIVNTNYSKYPGLSFQLKIDSDISEYEFDQILESIKFSN